ncbi:MAG: selenocysteine-specific translation elongation factor [Anaerolineaceae bacterium]|nr:selenocysteine-specific translation elongation factor [Anaerolineaceae bacterium]
MYVIGTAGHVDHGKSALIAALSGIHPDRLKEEITREMTIDLGFAWFDLPNGEPVGVIDVPGHRDFIENMLAGVGGIDATILVIAADEGIMPQTKEHLAIIDLLHIKTGVVALNKVDLISDPEWLDMVEMEIVDNLKGTTLEAAPVIRVSAKTKFGLEDLKLGIQQILTNSPQRIDLNRPRLPIDRVFSMPGFGTIVTGTLQDGSFHIGDEVILLPKNKTGRIRGLQNHKQEVTTAQPGSRTAININGINKSEIQRGNVIAKPGDYKVTDLLDCHFSLLKNAHSSLKHNTEVKLFLGAAEVIGRLRLLGFNELLPGKQAFIQIKLNEPVVAVRGDRFILRLPSPSETIGGGQILDPFPQKTHRRFNQTIISSLDEMLKGDPVEIILQNIERAKFITTSDLLSKTNLSKDQGLELIEKLVIRKDLIILNSDKESPLNDKILTSKTIWLQLREKVIGTLSEFHNNAPLKTGIPREALKSSLSIPSSIFDLLLTSMHKEGEIKINGPQINLQGHKIILSVEQEDLVKLLNKRFDDSPYSPPSLRECQDFLGEELLNGLINLEKLIKVSDDVVFSPDAYEKMSNYVREHLQLKETISLTDLRDHFQTSRKYALALLEHLDSKGVTHRRGDVRILKQKN